MGNSPSASAVFEVQEAAAEEYENGNNNNVEMFPAENGRPRRTKLGTIGVKNPAFGLTISERIKKTVRLRGPSQDNARVRENSRSLLELVKNNDLDQLLGFLEDPPVLDCQGPEQIILQCEDNVAGWTALHYAAKEKSYEVLEALVRFCRECPTVINSKTTDDGWTPLHIAVQKGSLECVNALLSHEHIELNVQDVKGSTPLHHACRRGYPAIFIALAQREETSFSISDLELNYPLNLAINEHHSEIFTAIKQTAVISERFTKYPRLLKLQNADGNTLLHSAVDTKYPEQEIIDWCIEAGFEIKAGNNHGYTPLHIAAKRGYVTIAEMLLERETELGGGVTAYVNSRSKNNSTPIYAAAKFNQHSMIDFLISHGANIEAQNGSGFTPLITAIRYTNTQCVKKLLAHNANILTRDHKRHLSALLWAVEAQSPSILRSIIKHADKTPQVAKQMWKERDPDENTAHHLAARASNLDILETLVQYDGSCLEEKNKDGCTPFHVAVKEGKLAIVNYIISNAQSSTHTLDGQKSSGLHLAAEKGHQAVAERLVTLHDFGYSVCTRNAKGWTPIHLAAMNGHHTVIEFLLQQSPIKDTMEIIDNTQATAQYLACQNGHRKCVEILLNLGAMVTYTYCDPGTCKKTTKSCLEIAIDNDHSSVVMLILLSAKWEQGLQYCKNPGSKDRDVDTPMRKLIKKMPTLAKVVFDKCISEERLPNVKEDSYYFKVHYNYEFLEDFNDLFQDGGPKFIPDSEIASSAASYQPGNSVGSEVIVNDGALSHETAHHTLSPSLSTTSLKRPKTDVIQSLREPVAQRCGDWKQWGPWKFDYRNHPLNLMIHHNRQDLLKHPLVASFIHYKWNLFGKFVYYPNILIYTLLMLMLTIYTHTQFSYARQLAEATNRTLSECSMVEERNQTLEYLLETDPEVGLPLLEKKKQLIVWAVLIILNCAVRIGLEVAQLVHHRGDYFVSLINYLEGFLYIATIIFVTNFELNCLTSWRWQLGALCIFLSWWNFILFLSQQPTVGIYVVMFQHIMKTFLHMAPMSVLLILAFGQPFFMLLSPVVADNSTQPFFDFPYSLLKTLTMTVGEFETDPLFYSVPNIIAYPVVTYFLWVLFLIIMPVLLQNMLVGLAVDDIKGVQEKAALKKEALQIEFILDVMSRIPKPVIRWKNKREYAQAFGTGNFDKFRKWITGQSWKPELKTSRIENNIYLRLDRMGGNIESVEHRMQLMSEQAAKLEKMMLHFAREQERYLEPARQQLLSHRRTSTQLFHSHPALNRAQHFDDEESGDSIRGVQFDDDDDGVY